MIRGKNPNYFTYHSKDSVDLISKLLVKDPDGRLTDPSEIKSHPFFQDIDWKSMMQKELRTPYKPMLDSSEDTKHFDNEICNQQIDTPSLSSSPPLLASNGNNCNQELDDFDGFTFEAQTILQV